MDRGIRSQLRSVRNHHVNVERYSLARRDDGRGFIYCQQNEQMYDEERISAAVYLVMSNDPLLQQVVNHQREWNGKRRSLIQEAEGLLHKVDPDLRLDWEELEQCKLTPRKVVEMVKQSHREDLLEKWRWKKIHESFRRTIESEGIDAPGSFLWLKQKLEPLQAKA